MVEISSKALGGGKPLIGGLTGLLQGLQQGYVQGRQLSNQQNLLQLQQEAGIRAQQGLQMEQERFRFAQSEAGRKRDQELKDQEIINRAGALIANAGDPSAVDDFVARHQAQRVGTPFGETQPSDLNPRLRSAYRKSQVSQLQEAVQGGSPELQQFLYGKFTETAKQADMQRGRQALAQNAQEMMKGMADWAAENGVQFPPWVTQVPETLLKTMQENPDSIDIAEATQALEQSGKLAAGWAGAKAQQINMADAAKKFLAGAQIGPEVGARANTDVMMMTQGLMSMDQFTQNFDWYSKGMIPVQFGNSTVGVKTQAEAENIASLMQESMALRNEKARAEIAETQAHADLYSRMPKAGTTASGELTDKNIVQMISSEAGRIRREQESMYRDVKVKTPAVLRAMGLPPPLTDQEIQDEAVRRVIANGADPAQVNSLLGQNARAQAGQPQFDLMMTPEGQRASKIASKLDEVFSKGMTLEQARAYLKDSGIDLNEKFMMSDELQQMLDTLRIMQTSGVDIPSPR